MPTNIDHSAKPLRPFSADTAFRERETPPQPDPVDTHIGMRLRIRRVILGLDQRTLGDAVGVSLQQIQKYERGQNRISASRLFDLAHALDVPIDYFFRDIAVGRKVEPPQGTRREVDALHTESKALVEAFWDLPDAEFRRRVLDLVDALAIGLRR